MRCDYTTTARTAHYRSNARIMSNRKDLSGFAKGRGYIGAIPLILSLLLLMTGCNAYHMAWVAKHQVEVCSTCPTETHTDTIIHNYEVPYIVKLPADTIRTEFKIPCPDFHLEAQNSHSGVSMNITSGVGKIVAICKEDSLKVQIKIKDTQIKTFDSDAVVYRDKLANLTAQYETKKANSRKLLLTVIIESVMILFAGFFIIRRLKL